MSNSTASSSSESRVVKKIDESFYFQDAYAYFEVQNTIFKVHRHRFEINSPVFRDMFSTAKADVTKGLVADNAIKLDGVSADNFRQLLNVMFSSKSQQKPGSNIERVSSELTTVQWVSVLKLSTMWRMSKYRSIAIAHLSSVPLSSAERVYLAMTYQVQEWFVDGLSALAQREKPMGLDDYELLGAECVLKVCQVRERFQHCASCMCLTDADSSQRRRSVAHNARRVKRHNYDYIPDIREIFAKEIASLAKGRAIC